MRKFAISFIAVVQLCCLTNGQASLLKTTGDSMKIQPVMGIETFDAGNISASLVKNAKSLDNPEFINTDFVLSKKRWSDYMGFKEIEIFPNPTHEVLYIRNVRKNIMVCMYDIRGILVLRRRLENEKVAIDHLPNGVYFIKFREKRNKIIGKFTKQELAI